MKKLLFTFGILMLSCIAVNAQNGFSVYTSPNQSRPTNKSQQQSQTIRTTAYYMESDGQVYRLPIKVQALQNAFGVAEYYVTEYYIDGGMEGRWQKPLTPASISKCSSMFSSHPLEKQFMFKANFSMKTFYFDL